MPRRFDCFNPRTRTGCDNNREETKGIYPSFNPRTRTGCDIIDGLIKLRKAGFNPRTRTGCDDDGICGVGLLNVSIHAPARGATYEPKGEKPAITVSIHAPARGATDGQGNTIVRYKFQSTHPHGVRLLVLEQIENKIIITSEMRI